MKRLATIDIGTNSVLLSIFEVNTQAPEGAPALSPLLERATVTRLGQGVDQTRTLHPEAIERTLTCLSEYAKLQAQHEVVALKVVGTSALRDAQGADVFLQQAQAILGLPIEIISGEREARLTFGGAQSGLNHEGDLFVFDIGGGSTELIFGNQARATIESCCSLNIGSVRLTERVLPGDPISREEVHKFSQMVQMALRDAPAPPAAPYTTIGVAGTMTTLAALHLGLDEYQSEKVHGSVLSIEAVAHQRDRLAALTLAERRALPCLSPGRADVIVAGATIAHEVLSWAGAENCTISDRGVRYGLLDELLSKI